MKNHVGLKCLIVMACCYMLLPLNGNAFDQPPEIPAGLFSGLNDVTGRQGNIEKRIASALLGVGKNLILENTRGPKEVAAYKKAAASVVFVMTKKVFGSGSIIDGRGHVITNWHVVKDSPEVVVVFKPKDSAELKKELAFTAKVIKINKICDLALLKINTPPKNLPHFQLGASKALSVGMDVHAIGHPNGEIWTYTKGFISQIRDGYEWTTKDNFVHRANVIQTQTPINPGNSGGPLFDNQGRLVGINSFLVPGGALNYAVAVEEVKAFLQKGKKQKSDKAQATQKPRCTETYDTTGQGWNNVYGCYYNSTNPPPDFWLVYRNRDKPPAYFAIDSKGAGRIDTVILSEKKNKENLWYYMDTDCDGIVDLIGHQYPGEGKIDSYKRPSKRIPIFKLAKELDTAFKTKKVPYPTFKVCQ